MENILFVASESTPFIKTGGLGDVIGSLPQALKQEQMEVRVILPMYDEISAEWKEKMEYVTSFDVPFGWRNQDAEVYTLKHNQVIYYFVANDYYFTRKGIYGYYDDGERFVYFSHAVMEFLNQGLFKPDILHAHDWQAAIAVVLANILKPINDMKTVFTIHNIKYQGMMPVDIFEDFFNLDREHIGGLEWNGMLNCLKGALFHADKITTVSPTYAEEIKYPFYSEGLHQVLLDREQDLAGILNGIDPKDYNPMTDPHVSFNYRSARSKKIENRLALGEELNMEMDLGMPLYVIISRLVEQKGFHLVQHILDEFLQEDVQFIVLGTGDHEFEHYFSEVANRYPEKLKSLITFDEGLARRLYASADFFLMPSQFEPCGLAQLIALQYKTVPIVRETGGLKDTVTSYNEITGEGNGFSFTNYNAHDLLHVLKYSLEIYHDHERYQQLIRNVNRSQFTWKNSAEKYVELYEQLVPTPIYG